MRRQASEMLREVIIVVYEKVFSFQAIFLYWSPSIFNWSRCFFFLLFFFYFFYFYSFSLVLSEVLYTGPSKVTSKPYPGPACWSCDHVFKAQNEMFCNQCDKLQPTSFVDYFDVLLSFSPFVFVFIYVVVVVVYFFFFFLSSRFCLCLFQ